MDMYDNLMGQITVSTYCIDIKRDHLERYGDITSLYTDTALDWCRPPVILVSDMQNKYMYHLVIVSYLFQHPSLEQMCAFVKFEKVLNYYLNIL